MSRTPFSDVVRDETVKPNSPRCKLGYRRICGTCRHFVGQAPGISRPGACSRHDKPVHGASSAAECEDWERPWAHEVAS